jgi:hypothetical protein
VLVRPFLNPGFSPFGFQLQGKPGFVQKQGWYGVGVPLGKMETHPNHKPAFRIILVLCLKADDYWTSSPRVFAMSDRLNARVDKLREDFQAETGNPFNHFFCPILHVDEPVPLCEGHIINEKFGTCNAWVPQRQDFDNFFGSKVEADFVSALEDRPKTAFDKWLDPKLNRRYRPQLLSKGAAVEYYITKKTKPVPGQTPVAVVDGAGKNVGNFVIKKAPNEVKELHATDMQIVAVSPDTFVPAIVASVLKATHLTMFNLYGYRHVFSTAGLYLAGILRDFFEKYRKSKKKNLTKEIAAAFRPHASLISPTILKDTSVLAGTVNDNRLFGAIGGTEGMFALGVLIPAGPDDAFCVWLPSGVGKTIDTYFGFLKEPPPSIAVKLIQFFPTDGEKEAHWGTNNEEPIRLDMPDKLYPEPQL